MLTATGVRNCAFGKAGRPAYTEDCPQKMTGYSLAFRSASFTMVAGSRGKSSGSKSAAKLLPAGKMLRASRYRGI